MDTLVPEPIVITHYQKRLNVDALDRLALPMEDNIKAWKIAYGPTPRRPFNILEVRAYRPCIKCDSTNNINRHHIASDYLFACLRPDRYAKRYMEFREKDIAVICKDCHEWVHQFYSVLHIQVLTLVQVRHYEGRRVALTLKDCEKYRRKFTRLFNVWLNKGSKKK